MNHRLRVDAVDDVLVRSSPLCFRTFIEKTGDDCVIFLDYVSTESGSMSASPSVRLQSSECSNSFFEVDQVPT